MMSTKCKARHRESIQTFYSRPILINYITALDSKRIDGTEEQFFRATVDSFNMKQLKIRAPDKKKIN